LEKKRVAVAMSGGVDSSVAAALLLEKGFEVMGLTMDVFSLPKQFCSDENLRSCCGRGAVADANRVAAQLQIPHYVLNMKRAFQKRVVDDFCEEYAKGRTPNPCIRCNRYIKFEALWGRARKLGADFLSTGHHARIVFDRKSGMFWLKKGKDRSKDQSYFLYSMTQEQLSRTLMPIGEFTKQEVRNKARQLGLVVHRRPESQEICFIPDTDYIRFLEQRIPELFKAGPIVDIENRPLGFHKGIIHYTTGQRRGIGIAAAHPLYVLEIRPDSHKIVVGTENHLYKKKVFVSHLNFVTPPNFDVPLEVTAKIRYKHPEAQAILFFLDGDRARLEFEKPQRAATPGQSAVFYDGERVVGGGVIEGVEA
jgi:tRNA-specific 2-thiouridylase